MRFLFAISLAIASSSLFFSSLLFLGSILRELFMKLRKPVVRRMRELFKEEERRGGGKFPTWLLPASFGMAFAFLLLDVVFSPLVASLGVVLSLYWRKRGGFLRRGKITEEAEILISSFRSYFDVEDSIFASLEEASSNLPEGELKEGVKKAVSKYSLGGGSVEEALSPLSELGSPLVSRFAFLLGRAESSREAFREAIEELEERARKEKSLRARLRIETARLRRTVRFLQAANFACLLLLLHPLFRGYWFQDLISRGRLALLLSFVLGASLYFDSEILSMEEML